MAFWRDSVSCFSESCTFSMLRCRTGSTPAVFTIVCSMRTAEPADGLLCCRKGVTPSPVCEGLFFPHWQTSSALLSSSIFSLAERLPTGICLAVAFTIMGSACRLDMLSSICKDEREPQNRCRSACVVSSKLNSCVNWDHRSRENEPLVKT